MSNSEFMKKFEPPTLDKNNSERYSLKRADSMGAEKMNIERYFSNQPKKSNADKN